MKRPVRLAATTSDAFGVQSVWTGRLENCYASVPDPNAPPAEEIPFLIRSVPGERLLLGPDQLRPVVGERLLGIYWAEHHNIPFYANKLMVVGSEGLALFDPVRGYEMIAGSRHEFLDAGGDPQAADVQIASNGHSWLITQPLTGQAWVYEPVASSGDNLFEARLTRIGATPYLDQQDADEASAADENTFQSIGPIPQELASFGPPFVPGGTKIFNIRGRGRYRWCGIAAGHTQHLFLPTELAT